METALITILLIAYLNYRKDKREKLERERLAEEIRRCMQRQQQVNRGIDPNISAWSSEALRAEIERRKAQK